MKDMNLFLFVFSKCWQTQTTWRLRYKRKLACKTSRRCEVRTLRARSAPNDRQRGMGTLRVAVTMMDQINEHFHSDSVSNINTIVYHSRAEPGIFISISFRNIEDNHFRTKFIRQVRSKKNLPSIWWINFFR